MNQTFVYEKWLVVSPPFHPFSKLVGGFEFQAITFPENHPKNAEW